MKNPAVIALGFVLAIVSFALLNTSHRTARFNVPIEVSNTFRSWMQEHSKNYGTPAELLHRLGVFYQNYLFITDSNRKYGSRGAKLGLNKFADLLVEEFLP